MDIRFKKDYAIVSTDIMHVNSREMRQMYELKNSIKDVLDSHKPDSKEKKYINDDDLKMMYAILSVFTEAYSSTQTSAFDDFIAKQDKPAEKPQQQETIVPEHTLM